MKIQITLALVTLVILCCKSKQEKNPPSFSPKVIEAHGYVVPKDSMAEPKSIPAIKPRIVPAGNPRVVLINSNVHPAGIPRVVIAGVPRVCTPGQDSFSLPITVPAIDSPFTAGIPEVVIAKEGYTKEQNPQNFVSFSKPQGLRDARVACLQEDRSGNLWIGTFGGGVSKYDGKAFTHFTVKQGLSNNCVWSMLQDKSGNLWFGTLSGLNRYDGKSFTHFTDKEGLSDDNVWSIYEDKSGNLWFGTIGGLNKYDGKSFTHFTVKEGLRNNLVMSMLEDKSGNLWLGTGGGGVSKYNGKSFTHFTDKEGLNNYNVRSIAEDKSGCLWFGTEGGGVFKYDGKSFTHFTDKEGLSNNTVMSIREDKDGNLWVGMRGGGVCKYNGKSFTHFTDKEGLSDNTVQSILIDRRGSLWFGTDQGGVCKYGGKRFTHFTVKEGLSNNYVTSILEDKSGNLWFGTIGGGASKYDGKSFTHFTKKEGMLNDAVTCMLEDKSGNIWFCDWTGASKYDGKTFSHFTKPHVLINDIKSIWEDKSGNIWFGTHGEGVSRYDGESFIYFSEKQGLSHASVTSILEDKGGDLWFGTLGGLSRYDGKTFTQFTERGGLPDNRILKIFEDKNGSLWVGTLNGGIIKYDGKNFTQFTVMQGLSNNEVGSILEDKSGNLWFGTNFGISKLEKDKLTSFIGSTKDKFTISKSAADANTSSSSESEILFKTYTYDDGFSGIGVNYGKPIHEAKDGRIWIATNDRVTVFNPNEETPDTIAPNIQVTGITLFNENISWQNLLSYPGGKDSTPTVKDTGIVLGNGTLVHDLNFDDVSKWYGVPERLSLAYNNNYLTFLFVGITTNSPKKVKYRYKLEGLDKNWSSLTNRSEAQYGNLPHGKYTFKVKAMNGDGYWSKEFVYPFTIRPPWWYTWWAYTLFAVLIAGFVYALFRYRLNKIRKQHEINQKTAELEMQVLRAQMNPHFIFNSLNSINLFILENNKLQASEYLSKFSRLVRLILQNSREAVIPLEKELEALQLYLELEALRFEKKFTYEIKVEDSIDTTRLKVPPLIIQPYAENAIWHGLMHKKERGHLEIKLCHEGKILFCKISDDGVGRNRAAQYKNKPTSTSKSVGMRITADRIALLKNQNQNDAYMSVTDLVLPDGSPGGTEVLLKIPVL